MPFSGMLKRASAKLLSKLWRLGKSLDSRRELLFVTRSDEKRRTLMLQNVRDLAEPAGHYRLARRHVFEQFCGRAEECDPIRKRDMRRHKNIAGVQILRYSMWRDSSDEGRTLLKPART
jgi:hypothetical protein